MGNSRGLEELTELEMQLPLGGRETILGPVEPVTPVQSERSERRHDRRADTRAPEEPRRIEVLRPRPEVTGVVEGVEVELLVEAEVELHRVGEEGVAERGDRRLVLRRVAGVAVRRDRELLVPAERLAVLHAAQGELLRHVEPADVTE